MTITIRDYQLETLDAILSRKAAKVNRQLCVLPTGTGKTIVFGMLAKELNTKTLIIAHREQLIKQAVEKVGLVWPEANIGVCMADRNELDAQIVVASIQSASRRLETLKEQNFNLLVIDEAHHCASRSYLTLIKKLGFFTNRKKLLLGVTATPTRKKNNFLGDIFQEIVFERSIGTMIKAGYLSDLKGTRILTSTSLDNVSTKRGDFVEYQLSEVCNSLERNNLIVNSFLEHAPQRKAIAFCCDVKHSVDLSEAFKGHGIKAAAIYGSMGDDEKIGIMKQFACGELQVLTNCALLTEGFDEPTIGAVLMCRPTRSQSLYVQCIGRGTRLYPSKKDCLILDFCDNFHNIQAVATLENAVSLPVKEEKTIEQRVDSPKEEKAPHAVLINEQIVGDFDPLDRSNFAWISIKDHWKLPLDPTRSLWLIKGPSGFIPMIENNDDRCPLVSREIRLDYAMGIAEDWVRRNKSHSWASKDAPWRQEEPSQKQIELLLRFGIDPTGISKGEAMTIIGQKLNEQPLWKLEPATQPQKFFLNSKGIKFPETLTKGEAMEMIRGLKQKAMVEQT